MWWGTAIEAPDPAALAAFYSKLLDWPIGHQEPGTSILAAPQGSIYVVFQQVETYQPPVWPPKEGQQRLMMHFDFQVGDLDHAVLGVEPPDITRLAPSPSVEDRAIENHSFRSHLFDDGFVPGPIGIASGNFL